MLTQINVSNLPVTGKTYRKFDGTLPAYNIRVTAAGIKTYYLGEIKIGRADVLKEPAARKGALRLRALLTTGHDPQAELRAAKAAAKEAAGAPDVAGLIALYTKEEINGLRPNTVREYGGVLAILGGKIGNKKLKDVARPDILAIFKSMRASPCRANKLLVVSHLLFEYAIKEEMMKGNPVSNIKRNPEEPRERVLSDDEIAAIWKAAEGAGTFGKIARLLILTGQRRTEVGGLKWTELSPDLATWTLPRERAKNDKAHVVPLSAPVQELLRSLPRSGGLVFPGRHGAFNSFTLAKATLDTKSGVSNWRLHDLRRTTATGLQRLGIRLEVTEAILNHVSGSRSGIVSVYQRYHYDKEKRIALDSWAAHVLDIVEGRADRGVLSFPQSA